MSDKHIYQVIADELKSKTMDTALWTQAYANAEGNPDRTEAMYIRLRFLDIKKSSSSVGSIDIQKTIPELTQTDSELSQLRANLAKKVNSLGKFSLYSTLSLQPDASDEVVAMAIADIESRNQFAGISASEFNFAKNTLGNPALREQYDRKLIESVANDSQRMTRSYAVEPVDSESSWMASGKMSAIIGILFIALIGYFVQNYFKERNTHEIQKESLEVLRDVANSATDTNQADVEIRTQAFQNADERQRMAEERQRQELELRASATERVLEQRQLQQERRAQAELDRQQRQEEQAEERRIRREKQYYSCVNQQLSQRDATTSDAYARCAGYR